MSLTKDGFYKSFSGAIGNNNYLLEAGGGHIAWGNGSNQIPYSNGTVNTNLNADMTDGLHVHSGRNNEANKIVRTDGSGYIQAGYINTNVDTEDGLAWSRVFFEYNNDGYIRKASISRAKTVFFGGQVGSPSVPIYWTGSAFATCIVSFGNSSYGEHDANNINDNGIKYYTSNGPSTSLGATTSDGALYSQAYSTSWVAQIAQDYRNGGLYVRGKNNGTWQSWYRVWDNRTTYVSGGKGYIGSTEITQVNNSDYVYVEATSTSDWMYPNFTYYGNTYRREYVYTKLRFQPSTGHLLINGAFDNCPTKYDDGNDRPGISITGSYPQLSLISNVSNGSHGPVLSIGAYDTAGANSGGFKTFRLGTSGYDATWLDLAYGTHANVHDGIAGWNASSNGLQITRFHNDRTIYNYGTVYFGVASYGAAYYHSGYTVYSYDKISHYSYTYGRSIIGDSSMWNWTLGVNGRVGIATNDATDPAYLNLPYNAFAINFRPGGSWTTGFYYGTYGNEFISLVTQQSVTSIIFANGYAPNSLQSGSFISGDGSITYGQNYDVIQIKQNCMNIGSVWTNGVGPDYKLKVNGKTYITYTGGDTDPSLTVIASSNGSWRYVAAFLAPNLTDGYNVYVPVGTELSTRNAIGLTHYTYGSGSTSNYAAMEIWGVGNIQRWYYGDMRTWFAGRVDASGFYHNSYGSSQYFLTSDGGARYWPDLYDGRYLRYEGWWNSGSGQNVDDAHGMIFAYGNHNRPGNWGIVATFEEYRGSAYRLQLGGDGWDNELYFRNRSADRNGWHTGWHKILHDGNTYVSGSWGWINGTRIDWTEGSDRTAHLLINGNTWWSNWYWDGRGDSPTWIWGSHDSGSNNYLFHQSNITVGYARSLSRSVIGIQLSSAGWKRVLIGDGTDNRGSVRFALHTTGGDWVPYYTEIKAQQGWDITDFTMNGQFPYINALRFTRDSSHLYIEAYFTTNVYVEIYHFNGVGYVDDMGGWSLPSGEINGGDSVVGGEWSCGDNYSLFGARGLKTNGQIMLQYSDPILKFYDTNASSFATTNATIQFNNSYATVGYIEQNGENLNLVSTGGSSYVNLSTNGYTKLSVTPYGAIVLNQTVDRRTGIVGHYDYTKAAAIWAMGESYQIASDGSSLGNLYGAAYVYEGQAGTGGRSLAYGHQFVWADAGDIRAALGYYGVWARRYVVAEANDARVIARAQSDSSYHITLEANWDWSWPWAISAYACVVMRGYSGNTYLNLGVSGQQVGIQTDTAAAHLHIANGGGFLYTGDGSLKLYEIDGGYDCGPETIGIQTCFDGVTNPDSHSYVNDYWTRCFLALQPRNGVVGIGCTTYNSTMNNNGTYKLIVNGSARFGTYDLDNSTWKNTISLFANQSSETWGEGIYNETAWGIGFKRQWSSGSQNVTSAGIYAVGSSGWRTGLAFRVKDNTGSDGYSHDRTALWLSPGGRVGINTGDPSQRLHVWDGLIAVTCNGYTLTMGNQNSSWTHMQTSGTHFWFNPSVCVDGDVYPYSANNNWCGTTGNYWYRVSTAGVIHPGVLSSQYMFTTDGGYVYWPTMLDYRYYQQFRTDNIDMSSFWCGYGTGMTTQIGPTGNWWHIFSSGWSDNSYWISQIAVPTADGWDSNHMMYRTYHGSDYGWRTLIDNLGGWISWNYPIRFEGPNQSIYARLQYSSTSISGLTMHGGGQDYAFYIDSNGYGGAGDSGGLAIDNDGVTIFGAGDDGKVFRVLNEDNVGDGAQFAVAKYNGSYVARWLTVGSQSYNTSYNLDVRGTARATNRIYANEWIQFDNWTGLYSPNNGAHFYPNNTTSYGAWQLRGSRNGYSGIHFGDSTHYMTLMDDYTNKGLYQEDQRWILYYNANNGCVSLRDSGNWTDISLWGNTYINGYLYIPNGVIKTDVWSSAYVFTTDGGYAHIGSMSVNYANYAGYAHKLDIYGYASDGLSFYQTSSAFDESDDYFNSWAHYIIANHGDGSSYYHYSIALPFWSYPYYKRQTGSVSSHTQWYYFLTEENVTSKLYWANLSVQKSRNDYTSPKFASIGIYGYGATGNHYITGAYGRIYFGGNFHIDSTGGAGTQDLYLNHYVSNSVHICSGGGNVSIGNVSPDYGLTLASNKRLYMYGPEYTDIFTEESSNGHISTNSPEGLAAIRYGFVFRWYDTWWKIGNVRGGGTNSAGFGIAYNGGSQLQLLVRPSSKTWIYYGIHTFASSQSWTNDPESGNNGISIKSTNGGMTPYIHFIPYYSSNYAWRFATYYHGSSYGYERNLILYHGPTSGTNTTYAEYIFRGYGYGEQGKSYVATCEGNEYNLVILAVFTLSRLRPDSASYSVYQTYGLLEPHILSQVRNEDHGGWYTMDGGMIVEMQMRRSGYANYTTKTTINVVSAVGVISETWIGGRQIGVARDVDVFHGSLGSFDIAVTAVYPTPYTNSSNFEQTNIGPGRYLVITNRSIDGWSSNGGIGRTAWQGLYENRAGACITFKVTCFGYMS